MELEIYFGGGLSIVGRGRAGYGGPQPLICKSYNGPAGEQGIYITEANGDFLLSLNSSSSIPNALNESSFITFEGCDVPRKLFIFILELISIA